MARLFGGGWHLGNSPQTSDPAPWRGFRTISEEHLMGKRALVTGGTGFIGSHVAEHCLNQGLEVTGVDDLSGGRRENVPRGARFVQGDLREASFVDSLWADGRYDFVYHLAAYAAEGLSHFVRRFNYETNLLSSVS